MCYVGPTHERNNGVGNLGSLLLHMNCDPLSCHENCKVVFKLGEKVDAMSCHSFLEMGAGLRSVFHYHFLTKGFS